MKKNIPIYIALLLLLGINIFVIIKLVNYKNEMNELKDQIKELKTKAELNNYKDSSTKESDNNNESDSINFTQIMPSEISSLSQNETIVIMIGRSDCGWCQKFAPVLQNAEKKYNFKARYIDLYSLLDSTTWALKNETEYNVLMSLNTTEAYKNFMIENFGSTPLTIIVKQNTIVSAIAGYTDETNLNKTLEQNGFKK